MDVFLLSVHALTKLKSDNAVESVYEKLEQWCATCGLPKVCLQSVRVLKNILSLVIWCT